MQDQRTDSPDRNEWSEGHKLNVLLRIAQKQRERFVEAGPFEAAAAFRDMERAIVNVMTDKDRGVAEMLESRRERES